MEEGKLKVRAVERALDILMCFTRSESLSLTEIASQVGLHKSTVHRLMTTLEEKGFVNRDASTEKYRLGIKIWELSAHLSKSDDPALLLLPYMERLRDELDETVSLYVRDGRERLRIQAVQSNQAIRRVAPVGARLPLYVGASSKVLVAFSGEREQDYILSDPVWPDAANRAAFRDQLKAIRDAGYAISVEEREQGATSVAAPIFDLKGNLAAALSVSGPLARLPVSKLETYAPVLMERAREMGLMIR
ncbi:IclR family transcriptional regulator [Saccharibacillus sp. CPCC 101409]|uniref:IclR family transcriptional regulator n=1 Tax=Saccharibacillus sp. CPCC 101409 TaxID=3058041 RepID=UPI002673754A|nr:IclR family transcriptional regulator [Saccharibacillus sp. CPCC 101409]MDO3412655.1 IclR family transcriptional regulator [Saccharibacillus sp. CPCC 101409]